MEYSFCAFSICLFASSIVLTIENFSPFILRIVAKTQRTNTIYIAKLQSMDRELTVTNEYNSKWNEKSGKCAEGAGA